MASTTNKNATIDNSSLGKSVVAGSQFSTTQKDINSTRVQTYGIDPAKGLTDDVAYVPAQSVPDQGTSQTTTTEPLKIAMDTIVEKGTKSTQGQSIIGISPFDNYYMFNVFTEKDGSDIPLDLSNAGTIYLSFHNGTDEVKISNYTLASNDVADISHGQVIFKISKDDARKILSFTNNNFYITSQKQTSNSTSDETVIYLGKFYPYDQLYENSLQAEYDAYKVTAQSQILQLQGALTQLDSDYTTLQTNYDAALQQIADLKKIVTDDQNIIDQYEKLLASGQIVKVKKDLGITSNTGKTPANPPKPLPPAKNNDPQPLPPVGGGGGDPNKNPDLQNLKQTIANTNYNTKVNQQ